MTLPTPVTAMAAPPEHGQMADNKKPRTRVRGFLHEAPEWRRPLNLP